MNEIIFKLNQLIPAMLMFFNDMAIYLIIGFAFAGFLHIFFPDNFVNKHLGKNNFLSIFKSSLLGIPIPICSCGVIPVATSLRKKGASKGATLSFLISTPQIGADSFMITYSLIGSIFAIFRIIAAFLTAFFAGIATNILDKEQVQNKEIIKTKEKKSSMDERIKSVFHYIQFELFGAIANQMLIGIIIAGLITVLIPNSFFELYLSNQFLSMLIMLILAVPMYVCATSSTPIAASLIMKGISPGAALVFLLAGPATNAVTISTVSKTLGKKATIIYLTSIAFISTLLGYFLNIFFTEQTTINYTMHHHGVMSSSIIKYVGSAILLAMFIIHYVNNILNKKRFKNNKKIGVKTLDVEGMSCNHCKNTVLQTIENIDGTKNVNVDLKSGKVYFEFENMDLEKVKKAIIDKGFFVKEKKITEFKVKGMTCNHCKATVYNTIKSFNGTKNINIDLDKKLVYFEHETSLEIHKVKSAITEKGFKIIE